MRRAPGRSRSVGLGRSAAALIGSVLACLIVSCGRRSADRAPGGALGAGADARSSAAAGRSTPAGAERDPYLDLVVQDPHGRSIRLADFGGRVRVFDIWATWCAPCRVGIPQLNRIYQRYRDRGLVVVGLSVDQSPADVLEFTREIPIRYPSGMMNPQVDELLGYTQALPTTLVVDRAGQVRKKFVGAVDSETLEEEIQKLL